MSSLLLGKKGEDEAALFLEASGYTILTRNFRSGKKEIDIVARDRQYLVFVEVKCRSSIALGLPEKAVDARKQKALRQVAEDYLRLHSHDGPIRFDVVSVLFHNQKVVCQVFQDAFWFYTE